MRRILAGYAGGVSGCLAMAGGIVGREKGEIGSPLSNVLNYVSISALAAFFPFALIVGSLLDFLTSTFFTFRFAALLRDLACISVTRQLRYPCRRPPPPALPAVASCLPGATPACLGRVSSLPLDEQGKPAEAPKKQERQRIRHRRHHQEEKANQSSKKRYSTRHHQLLLHSPSLRPAACQLPQIAPPSTSVSDTLPAPSVSDPVLFFLPPRSSILDLAAWVCAL